METYRCQQCGKPVPMKRGAVVVPGGWLHSISAENGVATRDEFMCPGCVRSERYRCFGCNGSKRQMRNDGVWVHCPMCSSHA